MKYLFVLLVCGYPAYLRAQVAPSFDLVGVAAQRVPVRLYKMTTLVFPMAIRTGIRVSLDIQALKVKGVENVLELKAVRAHFQPTNLSVFGLDGRLYCFDLEYTDTASVLEYRILPLVTVPAQLLLTGLPVDESKLSADASTLAKLPAFLHRSNRAEQMQLLLKGIYVQDSLLWIVVGVSNRSQIAWHPAYIELSIEDKKKVRRMAVQRVAINQVFGSAPAVVAGGQDSSFAIGYPLFTLAKNKKLVLELAERNGGRLLKMTVGSKTLLRAKEVPHPIY